MEKSKTYSELRRLRTLEERYAYLKLDGRVGESTFGYDRYLNQILYRSPRWRETRDKVIIRDNGCDLGVENFEIHSPITIHHMNAITMEDIEEDRPEIYDPEYLVCTSDGTHRAIHFGNKRLLPQVPVSRTKNDTCPWKR
jgi:hypothetical protein